MNDKYPNDPQAAVLCPDCRGTGDEGGNPSYGPCQRCGGKGKVHPQPSPIVDEVAEARREISHFLSDPASGYVNGISKQHLSRWLAALVSPPKAGEGEPVAWRWKAHGHEAGPWIVVHDKGTAEAAMSLFASKGKHQSVQPLYATQQPRVDGVRVTDGEMLAEMEKHLGWELDWGPKDANDEEGDFGWRVHERRGNRSDREWTLIGFGDTPAVALATAIRALANPGDGE